MSPSPESIKEILVEYYCLINHDSLRNPLVTVEHALEQAFAFNPNEIPCPSQNVPIYQDEGFSFAADIAFGLYGDYTGIEGLETFLKDVVSPVQEEVIKLLDMELEKLSPEYVAQRYSCAQKAEAIALSRNRPLQPSTELVPKPAAQLAREEEDTAGAVEKARKETAEEDMKAEPERMTIRPFTVLVRSFTLENTMHFLEEREFVYHPQDGRDQYDQFLGLLRFHTLGRTIPPPFTSPKVLVLPTTRNGLLVPSDPEREATAGESCRTRSDSIISTDTQSTWDSSTERPTMDYFEAVLARVQDERGYTLKDGPWIYRIRKENGFTFYPQQLLANRDDFNRMIQALTPAQAQRSKIGQAVGIIHSQDRIGCYWWLRQLRKKEKAHFLRDDKDTSYFKSHEYDAGIEEDFEDLKPTEATMELVKELENDMILEQERKTA